MRQNTHATFATPEQHRDDNQQQVVYVEFKDGDEAQRTPHRRRGIQQRPEHKAAFGQNSKSCGWAGSNKDHY